ncbi:MAG: hypothetical protein WC798_00300 [Candidatus Paceibacterota bacterium]|jgi:hypothetical protein
MGITEISVVLGFAAGAVQLVGYFIYNRGAGEKINTGSWSIWALGGIVDLASYSVLTGDWVKNILPAACAVAAISTFCYAIVKKRFSWPDKTDWAFVGADGAVTVIWAFTNVVIASLLYQVSTVLSFLPMFRGQLAGREVERPLPWLIWTLAYSLLLVSVLLRLKRWEELAYPTSHLAVHLATFLIARRKS